MPSYLRSHDWGVCMFAHNKEQARRRDPRRYYYNPVMCPCAKMVRHRGLRACAPKNIGRSEACTGHSAATRAHSSRLNPRLQCPIGLCRVPLPVQRATPVRWPTMFMNSGCARASMDAKPWNSGPYREVQTQDPRACHGHALQPLLVPGGRLPRLWPKGLQVQLDHHDDLPLCACNASVHHSTLPPCPPPPTHTCWRSTAAPTEGEAQVCLLQTATLQTTECVTKAHSSPLIAPSTPVPFAPPPHTHSIALSSAGRVRCATGWCQRARSVPATAASGLRVQLQISTHQRL